MPTNSFISAGGVTGAAKANTNSAVFVSTGLSIAVNPGERLIVNLTLIVQGSSTGGIKLQTAALPAGATARMSLEGNTTAATAYTVVSTTTPVTSPQTWVTFAGTGMVTGTLEIEVGAIGWTVDLQFAPAVNGQTATIHLGSNAVAFRL